MESCIGFGNREKGVSGKSGEIWIRFELIVFYQYSSPGFDNSILVL